MKIRIANKSDVDKIMKLYDMARAYMKDNGNPNQWENGYPDEALIRYDISQEQLFLVEQNEDILGAFVFTIGEEPTYQVIEQGNWNLEKEYGTIHRIASSGKMKGLTKACFDYCTERIDYLRIDTHQNNKAMQAALEKYGFRKCGIIYVRNGERIAFDYVARK
ncbi:MAG: N-acetyltransferase [Hespellia sp.]|nr:N-acetyltransferase [Hespellia sp.]